MLRRKLVHLVSALWIGIPHATCFVPVALTHHSATARFKGSYPVSHTTSPSIGREGHDVAEKARHGTPLMMSAEDTPTDPVPLVRVLSISCRSRPCRNRDLHPRGVCMQRTTLIMRGLPCPWNHESCRCSAADVASSDASPRA